MIIVFFTVLPSVPVGWRGGGGIVPIYLTIPIRCHTTQGPKCVVRGPVDGRRSDDDLNLKESNHAP